MNSIDAPQRTGSSRILAPIVSAAIVIAVLPYAIGLWIMAKIRPPIKRWLATERMPWMMKTQLELHTYWRHPWDGMNAPESYLNGQARSQTLRRLLDCYLPTKQCTILELGCNVGRNLDCLWQAGYHNLSGVDLNQAALSLMSRHYPEMAKTTTTYCSPIEDVIRTFPNNGFDVVFTMAVLQHIHPDSEFIFPEIARITGRCLITIEDEGHVSWRHFPRNYKRVFQACGMRQIDEFQCHRQIEGLSSNFWARIFCKARN